MADTIELEIVTPERLVVNTRAEEVQIPGRGGYMGILPGHAPLISELAVGEITYKLGGTTTRLSVAWGFAEVLPEKVTILAETAELAEDIDVPRAEAALARAQQAIKEAEDHAAYEAAAAALARAEARLAVASQK